MRQINLDSLPHLVNQTNKIVGTYLSTGFARIAALWWGVKLDCNCSFAGVPKFRRHPGSEIIIGHGCRFNSSSASNLIGINRPCIVSTIAENAKISIGPKCGFSGTVIGSALNIVIEEGVRCGANTLITDSDWHTNDPRTGEDMPVKINKNVWLGVNVSVLKGVTIGENTLVAAGSVVTSSLPPNVIAAGMPAKIIRKLNTDAF